MGKGILDSIFDVNRDGEAKWYEKVFVYKYLKNKKDLADIEEELEELEAELEEEEEFEEELEEEFNED